MRQRILTVILVSITLSFIGCRKSSVDILYDKKYIKEIKASREDIKFYMARNFIPGATFAVAKDGKIIYSEGVGLASNDLNVSAKRDTKFRIGEISELFTSTIYQLMIEDGILNPDSTVQHYLPDYPETGKNMTLKQLAYHTSGLRIERESEERAEMFHVTIEKGLNTFKNDPLESEPDLFQNPSMFNYNLLGAIMEKASGKHYNELLKEYITDTLHLENTLIDNPFQTINGRTNFHDLNMIAQVVNETTHDLRYKAPSRGILSNAEDLAKFGNAIFFSDYLPEKVKERLFEPVFLLDSFPSPMANGWMLLVNRSGDKMYGRKGQVTGGGAVILVIPKEKLVITGAINLTAKLDEIPVFDIASHFIAGNEEEQKKETP